jgi:hypothetical protein
MMKIFNLLGAIGAIFALGESPGTARELIACFGLSHVFAGVIRGEIANPHGVAGV